MSPAKKAAATRRIRKRAELWRSYVEPETGNTAARVAEFLETATRPTWSRPPLSREAILWHQLQHLVDAYGWVAKCRRNGGTPGGIGSLRAARVGMAALLDAIDSADCSAKPTRLMAICAGDLIQVEGKLERVAEKLRDGFRLEDGSELFPIAEEVPALQPADAREYRREKEARERAEREADSQYFEDVRESFDSRYRVAWEARDWEAVRAAVEHARAAFRPLEGKYGTARQLITHRAHVIREGSPPRYPATPRHAKGFAQHVTRERALVERLAWLQTLPGFALTDRRDVVTVKDRTGRRLRVSGRALRDFRRGDYVDRVNREGVVTSRTGTVWRHQIAAVIPA